MLKVQTRNSNRRIRRLKPSDLSTLHRKRLVKLHLPRWLNEPVVATSYSELQKCGSLLDCNARSRKPFLVSPSVKKMSECEYITVMLADSTHIKSVISELYASIESNNVKLYRAIRRMLFGLLVNVLKKRKTQIGFMYSWYMIKLIKNNLRKAANLAALIDEISWNPTGPMDNGLSLTIGGLRPL